MSKEAKELQTAVATGAVTLGIAALAAPAADAATFNVTNLNDSGAGSLRQAVLDANSNAGPDVITFQSGLTGTITLSSGELELYDSVDIQGPGTGVITVDANAASRVFYIYTPGNTLLDVSISGLTITNGSDPDGGGAIIDWGQNLTLDHVVVSNSTTGGNGGGVAKVQGSGTLHIHNSTITGNSAALGGGVYLYDIDAPADILDSVISNNSASQSGGGIYLYAPDFDVTIARTTISGNHADCCGGGVFLYDTSGGTFTIDHSTISGNTASFAAGGIYLYGPDDPVNIIDSTISGNSAQYVGGILASYVNGGLNLDFTTVAGNTAASYLGGVFLYDGVLTLNNSIIADSTAPAGGDVEAGAGASVVMNYSLIEDAGNTTPTQNAGAIVGTDPALGPLQNNGGPTQTQMPGLTSVVINAGDPAFAPPPVDDQRGSARVAAGRADMGAVEVNGGSFAVVSNSVNENAGSATITVNRSGGTDPATVDYATSNGSATAGSDYTSASGTLNFAANQTSATFNLPILDDNLVEGNETVNLTLSNPSPGSAIGTANGTLTIVDVEPGVLQLSSPTYSIAENGGSVTITVNRTNGSTNAVSVNYTTSNGSATAGSDYTTTSGILNFAAGQTSATFNVPILDDNAIEGNETFNVAISSPTNGATLGAQTSAVVTITDFEPGSVQFNASTAQIQEGQGSLAITVTRTGGSNGPLTVNYATSNGTATAGSDYTATSGTVTFADGDTAPKTITIPITNDHVSEPPETFTVTLSGASGGTIGNPASINATITDPPAPIPMFGALGKLLLALFTAMTGLFVINRNRITGVLFAIVLIGSVAAPARADKAFHHQKRPGRYSGTLAGVVNNGTTVTVKLTSGESIVLPTANLQVVDRRANHNDPASISALAAGQPVRIVVRTNQHGEVLRAKVKIVNSRGK